MSQCQPKAAPFFFATLRASSLTASRVASTMSTSSAAVRLSSHAPARWIRAPLAEEMKNNTAHESGLDFMTLPRPDAIHRRVFSAASSVGEWAAR